MRAFISIVVVVGCLLSLPGWASADSGDSEEDLTEPEQYSPDTALTRSLGYSLGVVGVGGALILIEPVFGAITMGLGLTIAPSIGHFYVDNWVRGALMAGARLVTATTSVVCLIGAAFPEKVDPAADSEEWTSTRRGLLLGGIAGALVTLTLAALDIAAAPEAARKANLAQQSARWSVQPSFALLAGGGGLVLRTTF